VDCGVFKNLHRQKILICNTEQYSLWIVCWVLFDENSNWDWDEDSICGDGDKVGGDGVEIGL